MRERLNSGRRSRSMLSSRLPASVASAERCKSYSTKMALPLESKTALVTGASKGIGRGIAIELARCGCDVAVNYNGDRAGAEHTAAEIRALGRRALVVQADVAGAAETERLFRE